MRYLVCNKNAMPEKFHFPTGHNILYKSVINTQGSMEKVCYDKSKDSKRLCQRVEGCFSSILRLRWDCSNTIAKGIFINNHSVLSP